MITQDTSTSWPELTAILLVRLSVLWILVLVSLLMPNDNAIFYLRIIGYLGENPIEIPPFSSYQNQGEVIHPLFTDSFNKTANRVIDILTRFQSAEA